MRGSNMHKVHKQHWQAPGIYVWMSLRAPSGAADKRTCDSSTRKYLPGPKSFSFSDLYFSSRTSVGFLAWLIIQRTRQGNSMFALCFQPPSETQTFWLPSFLKVLTKTRAEWAAGWGLPVGQQGPLRTFRSVPEFTFFSCGFPCCTNTEDRFHIGPFKPPEP